jgi:hypothetical protein
MDDPFDLGSLPIAKVLPSHNPKWCSFSIPRKPMEPNATTVPLRRVRRMPLLYKRGRVRQASRRLPARCSCGAGLIEKQPSAISGQIRRPNPLSVGLPGFYASLWHGLWLPKGTPKNITVKLNTAVMDALAAPAVRSRLAEMGQEIFPHDEQTPEALGAFQEAEIERWWPIVKAANIKGE